MPHDTLSNSLPRTPESPPKSGLLNMKFIGARSGISGSCTWLYHPSSDTQFLVDCGIFQGDDEWENSQKFPFDPRAIKYVLLTHAHLDHCGQIPKLVKEGFQGKVLATQATRDAAIIMLKNAAKLQNAYQLEHVDGIKWSVIDSDTDLGFKWGRTMRLANDLRVAFLRSSHILGATMISITWTSKDKKCRSICFSGDTGVQVDGNQYLPLMKEGHVPFLSSEYIVTEATYGNRIRDTHYMNSENRTRLLSEIITHTASNKRGRVIIPAFTLHRSQELIVDLWQCLREDNTHLKSARTSINVLVDSPLGHEVTKVYEQHLFSLSPNGKYKYLNSELSNRLGLTNEQIKNGFERLISGHPIKPSENNSIMFSSPNPKERQDISDKILKNQVIVASSGMCDFGPMQAYLKDLKDDPKNTIIITGYQSSGTAGSELMQRAKLAVTPPSDLDEKGAEVIDMSQYYSAHADQSQILDFIFDKQKDQEICNASSVFINHGNFNAKQGLAKAIQHRADQKNVGDRLINKVLQADARWFDLEDGEYITEASNEVSQLQAEIKRLQRELQSKQK